MDQTSAAINFLLNMGFPKVQVEYALTITQSNVSEALDLLLKAYPVNTNRQVVADQIVNYEGNEEYLAKPCQIFEDLMKKK